MPSPIVRLMLTALCAGCNLGPAAEDNASPASVGSGAAEAVSDCGNGDARLAGTHLCPAEAERLLFAPAPAAMPGCVWVLRDTPFATDFLLYRTQICDGDNALEVQIGNHMTSIVYALRGGGANPTDADGAPLAIAQVFAGDPDGRSRALWETRDSMGDHDAAGKCALRPPYRIEGLPADAMIVDVPRTDADLERDDAAPACGPFGYNPAGGSIDFWRTHQGYAWFFSMGTDFWDVDPGSFTLVTKDGPNGWVRVSEPS